MNGRRAQIAIYDQHRPPEMRYAGRDIDDRGRFTFGGLAAGNEPGFSLKTCAIFRRHDRCPEQAISLGGRRTVADGYQFWSARQGANGIQAPMRVSIYRRVSIGRGLERRAAAGSFNLSLEFTQERRRRFLGDCRYYGESGQLQAATEIISALDGAVEEFEQQSEADAESQTEGEPDHRP